jgi:hypothetical protein
VQRSDDPAVHCWIPPAEDVGVEDELVLSAAEAGERIGPVQFDRRHAGHDLPVAPPGARDQPETLAAANRLLHVVGRNAADARAVNRTGCHGAAHQHVHQRASSAASQLSTSNDDRPGDALRPYPGERASYPVPTHRRQM